MHLRSGASRAVALMVAVLALSVGPFGGSAAAQDLVPFDQQVDVLLKAFGFDHALEARGALRFLVLHSGPGECAKAVSRAFETQGAAGVRGIAVSAVPAPFTSVSELLEIVEREGATAVYVCESVTRALSSIHQVTRGRGLLSVGPDLRAVENGSALGVFADGGRPRLAVNLRAAKVEGLELSAHILSVAEVIR